MTGHIYLYGYFENYQDSEAEHWGVINLKSVMSQVQTQLKNGVERILVHIHSDGGSVDEGFAIYDYLKSLDKPIDTQIDGVCRSIATIVALAGENRTMGTYGEILIHCPWTYSGGEAKDLRKDADLLDSIENRISSFYSEFTNLTQEEALEFMKDETAFNSTQALEKGFITGISEKSNAVAYYKPKQKTMKNLSKDEKEKVTGFYNFMKGLFNGSGTKNLVLQDGNGKEIEFPDLESNETPKEGDKANTGGNPASGEIVMPDGKIWIFNDGVFQGEKEDPKDLEIQNLKNEVAQLKSDKETEIQNLKSDHESKLSDLESKFNNQFNEFKSSFKPKNQKKDKNNESGKRFGVKINQKKD